MKDDLTAMRDTLVRTTGQATAGTTVETSAATIAKTVRVLRVKGVDSSDTEVKVLPARWTQIDTDPDETTQNAAEITSITSTHRDGTVAAPRVTTASPESEADRLEDD